MWNWKNSWTSKIFQESMLSWPIRRDCRLFKWSNYPVNTTTCFRKRYLNWRHLRVIIKRKKKTKSFTFCTSRRGWDEDTFEPSMACYVGINWKILISTFKKVQFSSMHWKGIVDRQMFWTCFYSSSRHKKEISST